MTNTRASVIKREVESKNTIIAVLDEYFPEIFKVWKNPLGSKAARQILRNCPFPSLIMKIGEDELLAEVKKAAKRAVGMKKVWQLIEAAKDSVGVGYGLESTKLRLNFLLDSLEQSEKYLAEVELSMGKLFAATGYSEQILSIKGIGVVVTVQP